MNNEKIKGMEILPDESVVLGLRRTGVEETRRLRSKVIEFSMKADRVASGSGDAASLAKIIFTSNVSSWTFLFSGTFVFVFLGLVVLLLLLFGLTRTDFGLRFSLENEANSPPSPRVRLLSSSAETSGEKTWDFIWLDEPILTVLLGTFSNNWSKGSLFSFLSLTVNFSMPLRRLSKKLFVWFPEELSFKTGESKESSNMLRC